MKSQKKLALLIAVPTMILIVAWSARMVIARLFPIHHEGVVQRISPFHKGGLSRKAAGTRQLNQFALIFDDGFQCEGTDTSFAAIRAGDRIAIRAYHDVRGWPVIDPEWWECDEAQLIKLVQPGGAKH